MESLIAVVGVLVAFIAAFFALDFVAARWTIGSRPAELRREWSERGWERDHRSYVESEMSPRQMSFLVVTYRLPAGPNVSYCSWIRP